MKNTGGSNIDTIFCAGGAELQEKYTFITDRMISARS